MEFSYNGSYIYPEEQWWWKLKHYFSWNQLFLSSCKETRARDQSSVYLLSENSEIGSKEGKHEGWSGLVAAWWVSRGAGKTADWAETERQRWKPSVGWLQGWEPLAEVCQAADRITGGGQQATDREPLVEVSRDANWGPLAFVRESGSQDVDGGFAFAGTAPSKLCEFPRKETLWTCLKGQQS